MDKGYWDRSLGNRVSRRRALRMGAMGSMGISLALVGVACGEDDAPSSSNGDTGSTPATGGTPAPGGTSAPGTDSDGEQQRGGEIRFGIDRDPVSYDPHIEASYRTQWTGAAYAYNKLLRLTSDLQVIPDLATDYEISDDTTVVFNLREGVQFHDVEPVNGRTLTSEDVKFSLERIVTPQPEFQRAYMFEAIESIDTPDETTVVLNLRQPFAPLFNYAANSFSVIVAPEAVEQFGDLRQNIIGTGPFVPSQLEPGSTFQFTPFANYFDAPRPFVDLVRCDVMPDTSSRIAAMRANELTMEVVNGDQAEQFQDSDNWVVLTNAQAGLTTVRYNCLRPPFDDPRVRKAIDLILVRQENIDLTLGGYGYLSGPVATGLGDTWAIPESELATLPGYREDKEADIAEARALLDAAGVTEITPNFIYYTPDDDHETDSVAIEQQMLAAGIGITPELEHLDYAAWIPRMLEGEYDLTVTGAGFRDNPDEYLYALFRTDASRNDSGYSNPELDELLDAQRAELDEEARREIVFDIQRRLMETEVPNSWIYAGQHNEVVDSALQDYELTYTHNRGNKFEFAWFAS